MCSYLEVEKLCSANMRHLLSNHVRKLLHGELPIVVSVEAVKELLEADMTGLEEFIQALEEIAGVDALLLHQHPLPQLPHQTRPRAPDSGRVHKHRLLVKQVGLSAVDPVLKDPLAALRRLVALSTAIVPRGRRALLLWPENGLLVVNQKGYPSN